ncbi:hypothetical protein ADUPG1_011967 [Aduncisulcus paluster]|uniref:Chromo domain-containing protein n=1 Tax=Aduncisulcus paluster TaxID=2918883 RepID=A0ABQ5JYJ8_9EUKA|nr:hypothetical protein ADUPG1_011967 [Aduncisulcus paluster]
MGKNVTRNMGPFKVVEVEDDFFCWIESLDKRRRFRTHISRLRLCDQGTASDSELLNLSGKDGELYEVESIKAHGKVGKIMKFKVHWKDYSEEDETWEEFENVKDTEAFERYLDIVPGLREELGLED